MYLDFCLFFYYWGELLKCLAGVYTLFISKIHPNTEIRDQNLSPSRVIKYRFGYEYDNLKLLSLE